MKKWLLKLLLFVSVLSFVCSAAFAATITPIEVQFDHIEQMSFYARILDYNEESDTLTVELIAPETFTADDVEALKVGDSIYTNGQEILIESINCIRWGVYSINDADALDYICLAMDEEYNYKAENYGDFTWHTLTEIECPVQETLLFLDYINDQNGSPLELPVVHTARELTEEMLAMGPYEAFTAGLTCNNVYVTFDDAGNLATIHRFHVPWQ